MRAAGDDIDGLFKESCFEDFLLDGATGGGTADSGAGAAATSLLTADGDDEDDIGNNAAGTDVSSLETCCDVCDAEAGGGG